MKVLNLGLILLLLINCKIDDKGSKQNVTYDNYLEIFYLKGNKLYPFTITCDMIRGEVLKKDRVELKIVDKPFVDKFLMLYKKYKPSDKKPNHDTRIQILVHQGKKVDMLCLGKYFASSINGNRMQDSPELLALIKKKLKMGD